MLGVYFRKFLRNFPLTKETLLTVKKGHLKGHKINVSLGDDYLYGNYEVEALEYMKSKISKDDVVYDIGANAGYVSMVLAKNCKHVYSFEPMPLNIERMKSHFKYNKFNNITISPYAISDSNKELEFTFTKSHLANTYINTSGFFDSSKKVQVKGKSLDSLIETDNLLIPNLLKIDVEGAEYDVLKGAVNLITNHSPIIFLSTHDFHLKGVKEKCLSFLKELGYDFFHINDHQINLDLEDFICIKAKL